MPKIEVQLTIDDAIRARKRQEQADARAAREQQKLRKQATAGSPLFQGEDAREVGRG